jgi:hypothetical protein
MAFSSEWLSSTAYPLLLKSKVREAISVLSFPTDSIRGSIMPDASYGNQKLHLNAQGGSRERDNTR